MELPRYELKAEESRMLFEFNSVGSKGTIRKVVRFTLTLYPDIYNLAFGERIPGSDDIDDQKISNNGDSEKVLSTVASTIEAFAIANPEAWVYATGSTKARTRLYQICINKHLAEIEKSFYVLGLIDEDWHLFRKGNKYDAFLFKRKELILLNEDKEK